MTNALSVDDFGAFFGELHSGREPFDWQARLLGDVVAGDWPDTLAAPTGAGKTSVIDIHVFALAVAIAQGTPLPPRRLAMIVDRRALVDDQHAHARDVAARLVAPETPVLSAVAELLWQLRDRDGNARAGESPLLVGRIRGGLPSSQRWVDYPNAPAVLCATPEMWGSRLLFRGYGSSPRSWARAAGLLAIDSVAVIDEAHLSRQLLHTARRVSELAAVAEQPWQGPRPLRVVETTATPDSTSGRRVEVDDTDIEKSPILKAKLTRPKPVQLVSVPGWPRKPTETATTIVDQTAGLLGDATVGVFVNTVTMAIDVAERLRKHKVDGRELSVVLICGQLRTIDLERLANDFPGIFTPEGCPEVDVIVSTQSLEVGADLDFSGIVTELATGSATAQRAGRVNRRGLRESGPVIVIGPETPPDAKTRSGPYAGEDLLNAWNWLTARALTTEGLAPWALREAANRPPTAASRRMLLQRPELGQAWHWARSSEQLAADPSLELWLSDDLDPDFGVGIAVRALPEDPADALDFLRAVGPRRHETFPVPIKTARTALCRLHKTHPELAQRSVRVRGKDVEALEWRRGEGTETTPVIRPGDFIVVDTDAPLFTAPGNRKWPPVVTLDMRAHPGNDVLEAPAELERELRAGEVIHRIELTASPKLLSKHAELRDRLDTLAELARDERDGAGKLLVAEWLESDLDRSPMALPAAKLLRDYPRMTDVIIQRDASDIATRVLVVDGRRAVDDEDTRQEWTANAHPVTLNAHQEDVARRAVALATALGLPADVVSALGEAALHHDDGKQDPRFQIRLGAKPGVLLAKSGANSTPQGVRRARDRSGLPPGWRHEQRSVVDAWDAIASSRALTARLIGTTHGHGRTSFPHSATELVGVDADERTSEIANMLFDEGGWDDLIERTERRYGVWVCAYLEAVLRAADGCVSAEGH
ncbi:type I-U CRISPR-associated helicase/endonuclease Cas3 [Nocardia rhizosphaerihabitans]|uniref:type I-G CRISPR-associated helicase/endonuclease Cas3g n=1 Tax=Nocardia rhizosphaerihabitans TaxID=1691570 RepID=UPI00366EE2F7